MLCKIRYLRSSLLIAEVTSHPSPPKLTTRPALKHTSKESFNCNRQSAIRLSWRVCALVHWEPGEFSAPMPVHQRQHPQPPQRQRLRQQPQEKDAATIKADMAALPGATKFLEEEGGLVRWHVQF